MNITKEQADKVIAALEMNRIMAADADGNYTKEVTPKIILEALSIMRGLADAEPTVKQSLTVHKSAEDYLRYRYGSYRGHFAWRELEEAYSQGRYDEEMLQGPDPYPDHQPSPQAAQTEADELLRKWNLDPELYRTDGGALNHMKIAAALKHPDDYPHTAQTAVKSESLAQAAQALAQPPSEGKTIEALAPTEAALRDVVRQSEDMGLYDADFQTGRAGSKE